MDRQAYKDEIKFRLTSGVLSLELGDSELDQVLNAAFREIQRYIDTTKLVTVPYSPCINMSKYNVSSVSRIFRAESYTGNASLESTGTIPVDPMYASQWQLLAGTGSLYNFQDFVYNYASWNTLLQIRNTTSTDLAFRFERDTQNLYINIASNKPTLITVEYVPRYNDVSEILSDFWIDILMRMSVAIAKIAVVIIVATEAFLVIATHATLSPYVVLGQPPKKAPTIEPTPSPRRVL